MLEINHIYCGDCLELMKDIPDGSVDCCITSPPYWGLRDYGLEPVTWTDGTTHSLGLEPDFRLYIAHLIQIFDEVKRVLKPTGTCWVNLGDSYSGSGSPGGDFRNGKGGDTYLRPYNRKGLPAKSLCQIPSRFSIAMSDAGWILRNEIVWWKRNCMPSSAKDRFTVDFEKVFFFTKQGRYWFEQQKDTTIIFDHSARDRDNTKLNNTPGRTKIGGLKVNNYTQRIAR